MRQFFNYIFMQINEETLTDAEFNGLPEGLTEGYTDVNYKVLVGILEGRDTLDTSTKKLYGFFVAKGATFPMSVDKGFTNIFLGAAL